MNDPAFKTAAYTMAEATSKHLDKPTLPPQGWYLEGANLVVLLADGRKVRGPIVDQKRDNLVRTPIVAPTRAPAETVKPLPSPKPYSQSGKRNK